MSSTPAFTAAADASATGAPVTDRERLLLGIVELMGAAGAAAQKEKVQAAIEPLLTSLVSGAAHDIRKLLAEKLADAGWPPRKLIDMLVRDQIEIARPVIAASPLLNDDDLVQLLLEETIDHQIEIAQRPRIGQPVVATILSQAQPAVLTALAANDTADISPDAMLQLIEASRELAALRSPLARHPRMTVDLAEKLYAWVGQSLRAAIVSRFKVDAEALDRALSEAVGEAQTFSAANASPLGEEQREMERRLICKLHQAGQLRAGYLLRSLREQKLSLFQAALSALGEYDYAAVRGALDADGPERLALACAGVGIDRSVFGTVLALVRGLNAGRPFGDFKKARRVFDTFGPARAATAAAAFRRLTESPKVDAD